MVADPLPIAWRVRDFALRPGTDPCFDPEATAHRHARKIQDLFPECGVSVQGLSFDDLVR